MTPIVRHRPKAVPVPPPPPQKGPLPKAPEPIEFNPNSPLLKLLQKSDRTPTHPLTARGAVEAKKVTPVDVQKAEQAYRQAEVHQKRGRSEKAFEALEKAYLLNPNDEKIVLALAMILQSNGKLDLAFNLMTVHLESHPDSLDLRSVRSGLVDLMMVQLHMAKPSSPEELAKLEKIAHELTLVGATDKAVIYKNRAAELRGKLQEFRQKSPEIHSAGVPDKAKILGSIQDQAEELYALSKLPNLSGEEGEAIAKELHAMATECSDAVIDFVAADGDAQVRRQLPLLKVQKALAEGRGQEAIPILESYREAECKELGGGDFEKGLALLKERVKAAKALVEKKEIEEANKSLEGIPESLLQAHEMLEQHETQSLRAANLAILNAWHEQIESSAEKARAEAGGVGEAWDHLWHDTTDKEKITTQEFKELNLLSEVRGRIRMGKNNTIAEALKDIMDGSDAELKETAILVLGMSGFGGFGPFGPGKFVRYGMNMNPSKEDAEGLLQQADELANGGEEQQKAAAGIYAMVHILSRDSGQKADALKSFEALPEKIRNIK